MQLYDVTVDDSNGVASTRTVTVAITGPNDAPTIASGARGLSATEIPDLAAGENTTTSAQSTVRAGKDKLSGFKNVTGSAFGDILAGNSGANILTGPSGDDTLTGCAISGTFVFTTTGFGKDTITDFDPAKGVLLFANYPAALAGAHQSGPDTTIIPIG